MDITRTEQFQLLGHFQRQDPSQGDLKPTPRTLAQELLALTS